MDAEQRDALRKRNMDRPLKCRKCGSMNTEIRDGAELSSESHFAGMKYKVCSACGNEEPQTSRRRR